MDTILQGLDGVMCYLDDVFVMGPSDGVHLLNLEKVLERLQQHGFRLKQSKCSFLQPSVTYLGYQIDARGLHLSSDKLDAVVNAPTPSNSPELKAFLGLVNYYGNFIPIPNLSSLLYPLNRFFSKDQMDVVL